MKRVTFITGNQNKADYLARLLGIPIKHQKVDLDEIQSIDLKEVVEHKVRQAFEIVGQPVLVEDVSLEFTVLTGLPGTFIKFFVDHTGLEAICRMLDGFKDRSATAKCGYGYYDGNDFYYFEGSAEGEIALHPASGGLGFGWDKIFIHSGHNGLARSDLDQVTYDELYLRIKPIRQVAEFLAS